MNRKNLLLLSVVLLLGFIYSCDSDDSDSDVVPVETQKAFTAKYPSAKNVEWDNKGTYQKVDFQHNNAKASAWFDSQGTWYMSEYDIPYSALPVPVKNSFEASEYKDWRVDDVDMVEKNSTETVYIIEAENLKQEVDLYYSTDGILIKTLLDSDGDEGYVPQPSSSEIETFIKEKYPQSRIIEIEYEHSVIEVDIIHDNRSKDVYFDLNKKWLYTSWDILISELPAAVTSSIAQNPLYTGYYIDEVDFVETPQGSYYLVELEKGNSEIKIKIDALGTILK